ncbi:MAG: protein-methionine-sulfoxide reductase catalytic subunit MsrP [Planctomycetota bacterium]
MSRRRWLARTRDRDITPESAYTTRRDLLVAMAGAGLLPAAAALGLTGCQTPGTSRPDRRGTDAPRSGPRLFRAPTGTYPAERNQRYRVDRALTAEQTATTYNNFYEFTTDKTDVHRRVGAFQTAPWQIEIAGLVERPGLVDLEDLFDHLPSEERVYRFRCVEAWAMTVPWTGFPMAKLLEWVRPLPAARFVRLESYFDREQMPGRGYDFPYYEALTLAEAAHELTLLAHGIYGRELPRQNGAPLRLVTPWKYGLKNLKSIARIELTAARPATFWSDLAPKEYSWHSNVEPDVPHPRWSQATERLIPNGERVATLPYNGYADLVADLYG